MFALKRYLFRLTSFPESGAVADSIEAAHASNATIFDSGVVEHLVVDPFEPVFNALINPQHRRLTHSALDTIIGNCAGLNCADIDPSWIEDLVFYALEDMRHDIT
mmetsp:Transcript_143297/g.445420  ORF Transcript_143297/g.445420 Transcript_143297/m.445420 type:complete len:105 (-) Transcript_143297:179-493(-)